MVGGASAICLHTATYAPYGEIRKEQGTVDPLPKFSGKERDAESQLDYFGARYYDRNIYRFISVDPKKRTSSSLGDLQQWSLYVYCINNPISAYDPDGMEGLTAKQRQALKDTAQKMVVLGVPYASLGANSNYTGGDCNGLIWFNYKENNLIYTNFRANKEFADSTLPGHPNYGIIIELKDQKDPQLCDIGLQNGHMVLFAERRMNSVTGKEEIWVYSARQTGKKYTLCPLSWFDSSGPVVWYTYEVTSVEKKEDKK